MNRLSNIKIDKKRRKIRINRLLILLTLLALIILVSYKTISLLFTNTRPNKTLYASTNEITYSTEKDGFSTIFTTDSEYKKTYKEFKQDQNTPWANNPYWGGTMSLNGCGITAMSIIASGYGLDITPENLREKYYPHLEAENMYIALNDLGIKCSDFWFSPIYLNEEYILNWLKTDRPILICVDNTKENRWTEASHYMVLLACNRNGLVYLSNPNGRDGTNTSSGWYKLDDILPYIAKALFVED